MTHYLVLVRFASDEELDNPSDYVESAVAEMKGCCNPDSPEFTINSALVKAVNLTGMPLSRSLSDALGKFRK